MNADPAPLGDSVAAWLRREVDAGRLTPTLDDTQFAGIAHILMQASTPPPKMKKRHGSTSAALSKEARTSGRPAAES